MDELILKKYNFPKLEDYLKLCSIDSNTAAKTEYYQQFLICTDYIPNKLTESKILGIECKDYSEELVARQFAREQINLLRKEQDDVIKL